MNNYNYNLVPETVRTDSDSVPQGVNAKCSKCRRWGRRHRGRGAVGYGVRDGELVGYPGKDCGKKEVKCWGWRIRGSMLML
jgi:hypothetical protein